MYRDFHVKLLHVQAFQVHKEKYIYGSRMRTYISHAKRTNELSLEMLFA